ANNDTATTDQGLAATIAVLANDTDTDATPIDPTTVAIGSSPANGGVSVDAVTGAVTYTPNSGFFGSDSFTYTVKDTAGNTSNAATVSITVNQTAAALSATGTNVTATEGSSFSGQVATFTDSNTSE